MTASILRKYWFSVSDDEQLRRFKSRLNDPLRRWKLSPMDLQSITRWEDYSRAKDAMFIHTDLPDSPWYTVESEDKKRSRINVINHILESIPYEHIKRDLPTIPERPEGNGYRRPPRELFNHVPDVAAKLEAGGAKSAKKSGDRSPRRRNRRTRSPRIRRKTKD